MAKLLKAPNAQTVLAVTFPFLYNDTMVNTTGNEVMFGKLTSAANTTYDFATLPPGAMVIGGRVIVLTVFATSSANTIDIGDSDDADRYTETGAVDLQDADAPVTGFDLLGDGKEYTNGQNLRMTITNSTADATAGSAVVVVEFVVRNRATENLKTT